MAGRDVRPAQLAVNAEAAPLEMSHDRLLLHLVQPTPVARRIDLEPVVPGRVVLEDPGQARPGVLLLELLRGLLAERPLVCRRAPLA